MWSTNREAFRKCGKNGVGGLGESALLGRGGVGICDFPQFIDFQWSRVGARDLMGEGVG